MTHIDVVRVEDSFESLQERRRRYFGELLWHFVDTKANNFGLRYAVLIERYHDGAWLT